MAELINPEFSRPVRLDTLGAGARQIAIEANEAERAALARRFGLLSIESLAAEAEVRSAGEVVLASGRLRAAVTQACVASGDPVEAKIDEPFDLKFVAEGDASEEEIELEEADLDVIPFEGSAIDLGEAAAQTLILALDPFPRAPDAEEALRQAGVLGQEDVGPFAALRALKDGMRK